MQLIDLTLVQGLRLHTLPQELLNLITPESFRDLLTNAGWSMKQYGDYGHQFSITANGHIHVALVRDSNKEERWHYYAETAVRAVAFAHNKTVLATLVDLLRAAGYEPTLSPIQVQESEQNGS